MTRGASAYAMPRSLVLAASAGTGKTHALVGIVVQRLVLGRAQDGVPLDPSRIVATTFSRKAAAEIRARVATELDRLASAPATSPYLASLRSARALSDAALAERAKKALARLPGARFGTLHGFATGIVRAYAVELGLGPGFDLASEPDARARTEDALARALERALERDPDAVRALADAAGGIDRLLTQLRFVLLRLEEDGRPARDIRVPDDANALASGMRALLSHAEDLQRAPRFELQARALLAVHGRGDAAALEEAVVELFAIDARGKKTPEVEAFALFRKELPGARNEERGRILVRTYLARERFHSLATLARDVLAETEEELVGSFRGRNALGFGEVLRATRALLMARPDVAEDVASGMDALFVDEFQDTSRVQRDILQLLWSVPAARRAGAIPSLDGIRDEGLLVVGDRKQSIYGFRGADVGVFAELAVGLAGEPARVALGIPPGITWQPETPRADFAALRHNRRSVQPILAFANAFSRRRFAPGGPPPEVYEIAYVPETEDLLVPPESPDHEPATKPRTTWLDVAPKSATSSRLEEALVVAGRIETMVREGHLVGSPERPVGFRDMAVLATSNAMLDAMSFALAQAGIPYVVSGKSFFRAREVRDLAAMLALVNDPRDRLAAAEVLRGPWCAVHDETLIGLAEATGGLVPPWRWASPPRPDLVHEDDRVRVERAARLVAELSRAGARLGPGPVLREAVKGLGLLDVLAAMPRGEQRVANVEKLLAIADRHADPRVFRTMLDEAADQEIAESEAATFSDEDDAVRLLTVHASKGLDFQVVFVPEIAGGPPRVDKGAVRLEVGTGDEPNRIAVRLPDPQVAALLEPPSFTRAYEAARRRERAERQRLAYVAVTRARSLMFLVGGTTRNPDGGGTTSLGAVADIAADDAARTAACLAVEAVTPPELATRAAVDAAPARAPVAPEPKVRLPLAPAWSSLSIAPTALADLDHCGRRFELVHVLGLPERPRGARATAHRPGLGLDARALGTLSHEVLEHVPPEAFGGKDARAHASRTLAARGVPEGRPEHEEIVTRVVRFLEGPYARSIAEAGAELRREVAFVLPVRDDQGRALVLRGSMDLVVLWPGGELDVIDYKSARSGETAPYAFQLDVYALAARALHPSTPRLRAGLVFLGGEAAKPAFREVPAPERIRERLVALGPRLVEARWSGRFPRVGLTRCEAIYCGFIGRCHPRASSDTTDIEAVDTDA